ncbi:MAG: methylated-DNA--[protein]-cysteine S-methyltransferase [Nitrospinota bacterium]
MGIGNYSVDDNKTLTYSIFNTSFGRCGILRSDKRILRLILPPLTKSELKEDIREYLLNHPGCKIIRSSYNDVIESFIKRYFDGKKIDFKFPVDLSPCTSFQRKVYEITRTIPYGKVRTYKWIATRLGLPAASRAVGNALSRNPVPLLIPCHRVIRGDGGMGGFTAPGGIDLKIKMLRMEAHVST